MATQTRMITLGLVSNRNAVSSQRSAPENLAPSTVQGWTRDICELVYSNYRASIRTIPMHMIHDPWTEYALQLRPDIDGKPVSKAKTAEIKAFVQGCIAWIEKTQ
jgi:hypothetical protein